MPQIKAEEHDLSHVFCDNYSFRVPDYQRPYAWTEKETGELLEDILAELDADSGRGEDGPTYFLGSIVLMKNEAKKPDSDIVDGQQRLTTLTMLLSVLRDLSSDHYDKENIDKRICKRGDKYSDIEDGYRLNLRDRDREFFQRHIQARDCIKKFLDKGSSTEFSDSQTRLFQNTKCLWETLRGESQDRRDRLMKFLMQNTYLVVVTASNLDSAYRMFSVMNARGLDLSPTDILKAEIISSVPSSSQPDYTDKWEVIEEELGRDRFDRLFSHIRLIYAQEKLRKSLITEFQTHVLNSCSGIEFVDEVLEPYSVHYDSILHANYKSPDSESTQNINSLLKYLGRVDHFEWIAPAMAFLRRHSGRGERVLEFVRDLERLVYALFICRANINRRYRRYADIIDAVKRDTNLFDDGGALQLTFEEKKEVRAAINGPVYLQPRVIRPLLLRLNDLRTDGAIHDYGKTISVEHVLPQNPNPDSEWIRWFPNLEDRNRWTNSVANLVLLSRKKNTQARNYEFNKKKDTYFSSKNGVTTYALTVEVLTESVWTPEVLNRRQKELCATLIKEWRL